MMESYSFVSFPCLEADMLFQVAWIFGNSLFYVAAFETMHETIHTSPVEMLKFVDT
jgi:hypothetical protein